MSQDVAIRNDADGTIISIEEAVRLGIVKELRIRASRMPLAVICPQAAIRPAFTVESADDEHSRMGSACHAVALPRIAGKDGPSVEQAAKRFDVDEYDLGTIVGMAVRDWKRFKPGFPKPSYERYLEWTCPDSGVTLTCHIDLDDFAAEQRRILIADLKSGRIDEDAEAQVKAYGWAALQDNPDADDVYAVIWRPRLCLYEVFIWTSSELSEWWHDFTRELKNDLAKNVYRSGRQCVRCPRWHECDAGQSYTGKAAKWLTVFAEDEDLDLSVMDADKLVWLLQQCKMVNVAVEKVRDAGKNQVKALGGFVQAADGHFVHIKPVDTKRILFGPGEAILRETLGDRLHEALTVGKTNAEKIVSDNVGKGHKKQAKEDFIERLAEAGAVELHRSERMEFGRGEKQIGATP